MSAPHRVKATLEDGVWVLRADHLPGAATADDLADAARIARKFIALHTRTPLQDVTVILDVDAPDDQRLERYHRGWRHSPISAPMRWVRNWRQDRSA